ncbi:MAG TPA: DNA polymerase III subunit delta' [Actinomycetota bacterium]|nr:DNA polymerase III subunit delta' [Actinomycetota bacterium]
MSVWDGLEGIAAAERLAAQVAGGQVPHAWLLTGPRGAGKRSVAFGLAAALVCEKGAGSGCGECSGCARALRDRHPDVHHVQPEGVIIPVDVVREAVIPEAARSPFEATYKVFVIEDADRMNDAAQNALLKTLEEPQPDTVFVLVSDHEEEVLETIRSRCRVVRLEPVPLARVVELLVAAGASEEEARDAAVLAEGDVGAARKLVFDEAARARLALWRGIPARLASPVEALDAAAEIVAEARAAAKAREKEQKLEVAALAEAMGEGRGTSAARNALAKRHRRELRRVEEEVLLEALGTLAAFYRDVLAARKDAVAAEELQAWAESPVPDAALVAAAARCVETAGTFAFNANVPLAIESTLVDVAALVPAPGSGVGVSSLTY